MNPWGAGPIGPVGMRRAVLGGLGLLVVGAVLTAVTGVTWLVVASAPLGAAAGTALQVWLENRSRQRSEIGARPVEVSARQSLAVPVGRAPVVLRGRGEQMSLLRSAIRKPSGRLVVLAGLGGMGKTAIALHLAASVRRLGRPVWWVSARSAESLVEGLVGLAETLGGTAVDSAQLRAGSGRAQDRLWELLEQAPAGWLLVVDEADEVGLLGPLDGTGWVRPSSRGLTLVTSRVRGQEIWGTRADILGVGPLAGQDAAAMLLDRAGHGVEAEARRLAHRLTNLPLALHLAGGSIRSPYSRSGSFREYQRELDALGVGRVFEPAGPSGSPAAREALLSTWELSLDTLTRAGLPQARHLLRLLSCFAPGAPVPVRLLEAAPVCRLVGGTPDGADAWRAVSHGLLGLDRMHLLTSERLRTGATTMPVLRLHSMVAETSRVHLDQADQAPSGLLVRQTAVELVAAALVPLRFDDAGTWAFADLMVPHVHELLTVTASQLDDDHLAQLLAATAQLVAAASWRGAEQAGERLAADALTRAGPLDASHPAALRLRAELAWAVARNGRYVDARDRLAAVVEDWSAIADSDSLPLLEVRHKLAWTIGRSGDWQTAHARLDAVRDLRRRLLGDEHPDTLHTRCCLAWATWRVGRAEEAERAYQGVIAARCRVLGEDDVETLDARHSLAEGYVLDGRHVEAEQLLRSVVVHRARLLGAGYPETLDSRPRYWLGRALCGQGRRREAEWLFADLLVDQTAALGDDHPATVATRAWLVGTAQDGLPSGC